MILEQECNPAGLCAHQARRMSAATLSASLLRSSHLSAGACTGACLTYASSASLRVSMVVLACQHWCLSPAAYLVSLPSPFLLGRSHLCPSCLGQRPCPPLFSLVSLVCRCLHPGLPATIAIANNTFLVAVDSFSSVRTSQERWTRCRVGGLGCRRRH